MSRTNSPLMLQEAMALVLLERKHAGGSGELDTTALADAISQRKLFTRGDGEYAKATQVGARAKKYPALFDCVVRDGRRIVKLRRLPRR